MDFTVKRYITLLETLREQGFSFIGFGDYLTTGIEKAIILRHDVDRLPENSLQFAEIESERGIRGSYYFRIVPQSYNEGVIGRIAELGHEVGYHYEEVTQIAKKNRVMKMTERKLIDRSVEEFAENLQKLRRLAEIKTICMHGSPLSRWDNRLMWKYYDYKDFEIKGEPYFDLNCEEVLYLTDTGRRWDGGNVAIRDKILLKEFDNKETGHKGDNEDNNYSDWKVKPVSGSLMRMTATGLDFQRKQKFRSTRSILNRASSSFFPSLIMMTIHPQRWSDELIPWLYELSWQNFKNVTKYFLVKF